MVTGDAVVRTARWLRPLAWATLVGNIAIVVTGGAVRLTGSGLGCPTWPRCTHDSFVPHGELGIHGAIEFGNRMVTFVLVAIAVATWIAAMRARPRRHALRVLATILVLGIPGQALIGGITVLTDLNPWVVSLHLMLSMVMITLAVVFLHQVHHLPGGRAAPGAAPYVPVPEVARRLAVAVMSAAFLVLYLGTVVTGAGPHAGHFEPKDLEGNQVHLVRNGLDPQVVSHVHAGAVYLLVALTVATLVAAHRTGAPEVVRRVALTLLLVEAAQATVGFTQYFTDLPVLLVGVHLFGAALMTTCAAWLLMCTRGSPPDASTASPPAAAGGKSTDQAVTSGPGA